jgi:hypothetical protein
MDFDSANQPVIFILTNTILFKKNYDLWPEATYLAADLRQVRRLPE